MERTRFFLSLSLVLGLLAITAFGQAYDEGQYPSTTPIFGVTYSPFQFNPNEFCLPTSTVQSDMNIIKGVSDHVRLYGISACLQVTRTILDYASNNDMRVLLGLFLSGDAAANMREVNALEPLLEDYASVVDAIIVGNELVFARTVRPFVFEVKQRLFLVVGDSVNELHFPSKEPFFFDVFGDTGHHSRSVACA